MRARGAVLVVIATAALGVGALLLPRSEWAAMGGGLVDWYEVRGASQAAVAVLRLVAAAGCAWIAAAAALQVLARVRPLRSIQRLADRVSPAVLRRVAGAAMAVGTSAASTLPAGAGPEGGPPGTATMVVIESPSTVPPASPAVPAVVPPAVPPAFPPVQPTRPVEAPVAEEVRVELGDSFWSLAEEVLAETSGPAASEEEVARYWRRLVAANLDRLVDPGNADLLLPGQVLVVPSP